MRKVGVLLLMILMVLVIAACGPKEETDEHEGHEDVELSMLEVDFKIPETGVVGEEIELKATVTYGDELVVDADEVKFEIWLEEDKERESSDKIDGDNNSDGTYTLAYTFDAPGVYEMYAHTTARDLHTMPKQSITITE